MAPFFYLTSGRGGGGIIIICWMLFSRKRTLCVSSLVIFFSNTAIPAASREGYFVCILTCDIFILTCHTNCFLGLDVNSTCFIYCTPTSFPLFLSDTFLPDPFFIQVLSLPSLFFYQTLFIQAFWFQTAVLQEEGIFCILTMWHLYCNASIHTGLV